jgi:hypothetical protein
MTYLVGVRSRLWPLTIQQECFLVGAIVAVATMHFSLARTLGLPIGVFNDDAVYTILGKAIATGQGYRSIHLVGAPLQTKFPPVWPAMLAIFWVTGRTTFAVYVLGLIANLLACGTAAGFLWWLGRERLVVPASLMAPALAIGFLLDPAIQYSMLLLSEPVYLLEWVTVLFLIARGNRRPVLVGLLLAALALTRTQGVFVAAAILLALWLDRIPRRTWMLTALIAIAPVIVWHLGVALAAAREVLPAEASERSYAAFVFSGSASQVIKRELAFIVDASKAYVALIGTMMSGYRTVAWIAGIVTMGLALAGLCAKWAASRSLVLSAAATLALLILWPAFSDRYLVGALPAIGVLAAAGAATMLRTSVERWRLPAGILAAILVWTILARQSALRESAGGYQSPSRWLPGNGRFVLELSAWARRNTSPTDRLAVASAGGVWLYSGRQTIVTEFAQADGTESGGFLARIVARGGANVIVAEAPGAPVALELERLQAACPSDLTRLPGFPLTDYPRMVRVVSRDCIDSLARSPGRR